MFDPVLSALATLQNMAYGYRDYAREASFLREAYRRRRGRPPQHYLEIAAAPYGHVLAMARAGVLSSGLAHHPTMIALGARAAAAQGLRLELRIGEMRSFEHAPVDLVACMLGSASYLPDDEAWSEHLGSVAAALAPDGLYVLELPHPTKLPREGVDAQEQTVTTKEGELDVAFIEEHRVDDAGHMTLTCTARLSRRELDGSTQVVLEGDSLQRWVSEAELAQRASASGLAVVEMLGALEEGVGLYDERAWRMVALLEPAARS